jgi:hypothetical protein
MNAFLQVIELNINQGTGRKFSKALTARIRHKKRAETLFLLFSDL